MRTDFLLHQMLRIKRRFAYTEALVREGRLDSLFKATKVIPAQQLALSQIHTGHYGRCIDCDESIPKNRLKVLPAAIRCVECQKQVES